MGLPTIAVPQYTLTVPSTGKEIKYRPFLVKEEKILLLAMESDNPSDMVDATKEIINNCTYGDFDANNSPVFDIEYIFLQLRGKAKGEVIDLKYKCPKCEQEIPVVINIDDIKIRKTKEHTQDIKITDELGVIMKYPNLSLQTEITKEEKKPEIERLFETIVACIDYIYDKDTTYPSKDHTTKEMTDFLESLTDTQFQKLSKFFETAPVLKHDVELYCKNKGKVPKGEKKKECGYKEKITLEGLNSFFA